MNDDDDLTWARRMLIERVWNGSDAAAVDEVFGPDFVGHDPNRPEIADGPEAVKRSVRSFRAAFPDLSISVDDLLAVGGMIVWRYTLRGTHRGPFLGVDPTGRRVAVTGISIFRREAGLLREAWVEFDALGLLRQLGALPAD